MDANNINNKINIIAMVLTVIVMAIIVGGAFGFGWNLLSGKGIIGSLCGFGLLWFGVSLFVATASWLFNPKER